MTTDPFVPEPYIEVAFGFGPYDNPTGGDWVDITDYVDEIHTSRGRSNELDTFPPGVMKLRLDNRDRRFDPLNSSGPYFGDLIANVPIRFYADVGGTDKDVWYGFVDGWPTSYDEGGFNVEMDISCSDIFKIFAERSAPDTMVEDIEAMIGANPLPAGIIRRWYRFNEVRGGEQVIPDKYGTGGTDLEVFAKWDNQERVARCSAEPTALGLTQHQAPSDAQNLFMGARNVIGPFDHAPIRSDHWAIAMTFRITETGQMGGYQLPLVWIGHVSPNPYGAIDHQLFSMGPHHGGQHHPSAIVCPGCFMADTETAGTSLFCDTGPGGTNDLTGSSPLSGGTWNPFDGQSHSVIVWRHTTTLEIWADGVLVANAVRGGATGLDAWDPGHELRVYWPWSGSQAVGRVFPGVVVQELIFFDAVNLSTFLPGDVHDALMVGMEEVVPSGDAAAHLMNRIGWNPLRQQIDDCEVQVHAPPNPYGESVMELLQNYADCEDGRLFVDRHGDVNFHANGRFQVESTEINVQYAFDDTSATSVSIDGELRVTLDDEWVYETAEISRDQGTPQVVASTSTPARTFSLSGLRLTSDHAAKNRAERVVFKNSAPKIRTESYDVWPEADSADWATLLDLEIGHRVQLIVTPRQVGSQIDIEQHLELIEHHVTPTDWVMTLNGSPVDDSVYLTWGAGTPEGWGNGLWR